jgi:hypothetical protein
MLTVIQHETGLDDPGGVADVSLAGSAGIGIDA